MLQETGEGVWECVNVGKLIKGNPESWGQINYYFRRMPGAFFEKSR
jgi:hypothetical protein